MSLFSLLFFLFCVSHSSLLHPCVVSTRWPAKPHRTVVVDQSGHGNFRTIGDAVGSVPSGNQQWVFILIRGGVYREKVEIPPEKEFIYLRGEGKRRTIIEQANHSSIVESATLTVSANNFYARSISFINSYNLPVSHNKNPRVPAVAAFVNADKAAFFRCGFFGVQDTLWDATGRHYFKRCTVFGAVDFIFGSGQSLYEKCTIVAASKTLGLGIPGYITAQGRTDPEETNGFVFKDGNIVGDGLSYLGRAWRSYALVLFYNTSMSNVIVPQGWDAWFTANHEDQLSFAEYGNSGSGSDTSRRVKWALKMSKKMVNKLTSLSYINEGNWLQTFPNYQLLLA